MKSFLMIPTPRLNHKEGLPQLSGGLFLTDGGIETTLIFREGLELPSFAAFVLLKQAAGRAALQKYFRSYLGIAKAQRAGFILESPTWRANPDWAAKLGCAPSELNDLNRQAIALMHDLRQQAALANPVVVSGCIGPRDDGYNPQSWMKTEEAQAYHTAQVQAFQEARADMVCAMTMTYAEEATGITRAAQAAGLPVAISFTVETNGQLPNGQPLKAAIEQVDAATGKGPAYYMINCAHPVHFDRVLTEEPWVKRLRGVRANASMKSHAELNETTTLDAGNPQELGAQCQALVGRFKHLNVLGGCCGTDERHIEAIGRAVQANP